MSVVSKLLSLFLSSDFCSLSTGGKTWCLHSPWANIAVTLYLADKLFRLWLTWASEAPLCIVAFVLPTLGCSLLSRLLYRATWNAWWCWAFEVRHISCSQSRYVVLPRPVCFEKGLNYTIRLELSQYSSVDTEMESPYTLIDSVSTNYLRGALVDKRS